MYRMRIYESAGDNVAESTRIFQELVRPVHEKYGARLVGRWLTDDGKIVVIWQYRDIEHCRGCLQSVKEDPESKHTLPIRTAGGLAEVARREVFMTSTLPSNGPQ